MTDNDYTGLIEQLRRVANAMSNEAGLSETSMAAHEAARALEDLQAQLTVSDDLLGDPSGWLLEAIATATQNRMFLRGDPGYDAVVGEAILENGKKAFQGLHTQLEKEAAQRIEQYDLLIESERRREAADAREAALQEALGKRVILFLESRQVFVCDECAQNGRKASLIQHKPDCLLAPAPQGEEGKPHVDARMGEE